MTTLELDLHGERVVRRALKLLQAKALKAGKAAERKGWKPEPGHVDLNRAMYVTAGKLLRKLPYRKEDESC